MIKQTPYKLYCFGESGHSYKVALALKLSQKDWQPVFVDFFNGEARSDKYKNTVNPMGEVPVLCDNGQTFTQSGVILDYLHEKTGIYYGRNDAERREILRWVIWDNSKFSGSIGPTRFLMNFIPADKRPHETINFMQNRNNVAFSILDTHLKDNEWIAADQFSAADLSCCSYLFYPEEFGFDRKSLPNIDRWLGQIETKHGWAHPYEIMKRAYPPSKKD